MTAFYKSCPGGMLKDKIEREETTDVNKKIGDVILVLMTVNTIKKLRIHDISKGETN